MSVLIYEFPANFILKINKNIFTQINWGDGGFYPTINYLTHKYKTKSNYTLTFYSNVNILYSFFTNPLFTNGSPYLLNCINLNGSTFKPTYSFLEQKTSSDRIQLLKKQTIYSNLKIKPLYNNPCYNFINTNALTPSSTPQIVLVDSIIVIPKAMPIQLNGIVYYLQLYYATPTTPFVNFDWSTIEIVYSQVNSITIVQSDTLPILINNIQYFIPIFTAVPLNTTNTNTTFNLSSLTVNYLTIFSNYVLSIRINNIVYYLQLFQ